MLIQLNDSYRVKSDRFQWILQKKAKSEDSDKPEKWSNIGYYPDLAFCLSDAMEKMVRLTEGSDLSTAIQEAQQVIDAAMQQALGLKEAQETIKRNVSALFTTRL